MKICFVQLNTDYQVSKHRYALALTFPQLIADLNIEDTEFSVYVCGKAECSFSQHIESHETTHVFISAITSTFPAAIDVAKIAKQHNCIVALGGLFASLNPSTICNHFTCFDYVVTGHPDDSLINRIKDNPSEPTVLTFQGRSDLRKPLGRILTDQRFTSYYDENDTVCYELTNGCLYNCSFCTIRGAFPNSKPLSKPLCTIQEDLQILSGHWNKLKLIDDDIYNSLELLTFLDFHAYEEVIAEIRVDEISDESIQVLKRAGITHLIVGIESFDEDFLTASRKTHNHSEWIQLIDRAIALCQINQICFRPVLMIVTNTSNLSTIEGALSKVQRWTPENGIELLCSFYTPHPGMKNNGEYSMLLTTNLLYYDHLHCIWLPPSIPESQKIDLVNLYNRIVMVTDSAEYNPPISFTFSPDSRFDCFFER